MPSKTSPRLIEKVRFWLRNRKIKSDLKDFANKEVVYKTGDKELGVLVLSEAYRQIDSLKGKTDTEIGAILNNLVKAGKKELRKKRKGTRSRIARHKSISAKEIEKLKASSTYLVSQEKQRIANILNESKIFFQNITDEYFFDEAEKNLGLIAGHDGFLERYNPEFIEKRKEKYANLFKKENIELDDEQKTAIVTDDKYNLVVAGAGSGKTEVLTTRIAYLIKREPDGVKPSRILALAFQDDAKKEIEKRLEERYGVKIEVRTFHSLGLKILGESGLSPQLKFGGDNSNSQYCKHIKELYNKEMENPGFQVQVINYIERFGDPGKLKKEADFPTKAEYHDYMRNLRYETLNSTKVKSEAEKEIMNFFLSHKINDKPIKILYESPAKWMSYKSKKNKKTAPKPDFYLSDFNIYLEHWALNEKGEIPAWFGITSQEYKQGMESKKRKFKGQKKYSLIETFSYESRNREEFQKILKKRTLKALKRKFPGRKFNIKKMDYRELVEKVWDDFKQRTKGIPRDIANYIRIAKTYNLTPRQIDQRLSGEKWSKKQEAFSEIALAVYRKYQEGLRDKNQIDFSDMINLAVEELTAKEELYKDKFDHILVDEYQDISKQRFLLLKALLEKNSGCKLFCVGDDWQSIMAFAGANLDYFVRFGEYIGEPEFAVTYLSKNYRSIKSVVDTGASIIRHNGASQLAKNAIAKAKEEKKIVVYELTHKKRFKRNYYCQMAEHCLEKISELLEDGYKPHEIMILSRIKPKNSYLAKFIVEKAKEENIVLSQGHARPDAVRFLTVHSSKGLQARVVFILDVKKDLYGFPCELEDAEILEPAVDAVAKDKEEEERRLFYVAVTRAKEDVFIYTMANEQSKFLKEISQHLAPQKVSYRTPSP